MKSQGVWMLRVGMLLVMGVVAPGQAEETVIGLHSEWTLGDKHLLELLKERKDYRNGKLVSENKTRTLIDVEVLRRTDEGYVLRWTYRGTEMLAAAAKNNPFVQRMASLNKGMHLDIRTDTDGTPIGLDNLEEVIALYEKVFEELELWLKKAGFPPEQLQQVMKGIEPLMNPETAEVMAMKEPGIFLLVCGGSFALNERQEYEDLLPNPFGGEPFPSRAYFLLKEVNAKDETAIIEWKQTLDPDKTKDVLEETLRKMMQRMGSETPEEEMDLPVFSIEDDGRFVIDTSTGWPRSVSYRRSVSSGDRRRIDASTFRPVSDEGEAAR
jgi:hypothetical protein